MFTHNAAALRSKPVMTSDKERSFTTFLLGLIPETKETNDMYNALAMYNLAESVIETVGNDGVVDAAKVLSDNAHWRLEQLAGELL